ncbi:MAG TPA: flagellar hook capping FlgD N-terminal domain-containing protein [Patescibacteria group bacterium]|nr:flagellar hook capping FlgD N-terminal domain-containing protein [Patescibacteria group bacterium]
MTVTSATNSTSPTSVASSSSASQSAIAQQSLAGNMNSFLTLLTAQLNNQDPLSPTDSSQFTNQLVQFAAVQQQIDINANLEKMLATSNSSEMASAVTYLGNTVTGVSTQLPLQSGAANLDYTTPAGSAKVTITISDSAGNIVSSAAGDSTAGTHAYSWNGQNMYGVQQSDGTYTVAINSVGTDGTNTTVDAAVSGVVTSMGMDASNNVQLYMNGVDMPLASVIKVTLPMGTSASSASSSTASNTASSSSKTGT